MFFQYMKVLEKGESKYSTMRVGELTQELLNAYVKQLMTAGWVLASDEDVIKDRGALITDTPEELADLEAEKEAAGNEGLTPDPVPYDTTVPPEVAPETPEVAPETPEVAPEAPVVDTATPAV